MKHMKHRNNGKPDRRAVWLICAAATLCLVQGGAVARDKKPAREDGEFKIYANGKEIGSEKYVILSSEDAATSSSVLDFRNPGDKHQHVQLETKLDMDGRYQPKIYQLKSNVDGQKGTINGQFSQNQAMFEYVGSGVPRKSGLLVGDQFTLLDTNIFHHFIFLARLFKYGSKERYQRFEVVIPQEQDNGQLKISELEKERIAVGSRKIETHHLRVDSGSVVINLWVDDQKVVHRITVPDRQIEVVRNP
jgi:hypothetical protein